jgi:predicted HTH domain antitoxin
MGVHVDGAFLRQVGLTETEALIEFACRLYQADRISLPLAARWATLSRPAFEGALGQRGIPACVITKKDFGHDPRTLGISESAP